MRTFLINLARRSDRFSAMAVQLNDLGLDFQRVVAFDADCISDTWLAQYFRDKGPLGALAKGDQCCALSHRKAWSTFLSTGAPYGVVMEDDVALDPAAGELLKRDDWIPPGVDLLKLEHFGPPGQRVLLGRPTPIEGGRSVAEIHSRHTGAGAYAVSRAAAQLLLAADAPWTVSVDHLLFNPNVSPLAGRLRAHQLLPVIARQTPAVGGASDIGLYRAAQRRLGLKFLMREVRRGYYEIRLLPRQIARVLTGEGSLARVQNEALTLASDHFAALYAPVPVADGGAPRRLARPP